MNLDKININEFLNKYISFVDNISIKYGYDSNIKHVLYIIVPSFIIKYDIKNERKILKLFEDIKIIINNKEDNYNIASFERRLIKDNDNYIIDKKVLLNKYKQVSLIELIDSLIHEFNHAINSINNELYTDRYHVYLRSGIINTKYDKETLNIIDNKEKYIILEEVLNTIETEQIINIILSLNKYKDIIQNSEFINMLYALNNEVGQTYKSNAYLLQTFISEELTKNKTFTSTLNNLRFIGNINNIESWFDNITGINNSFYILCDKLTIIKDLEIKHMKRKIFKNIILSKIREEYRNISTIIENFNNNCIYK